MAKDLVQVSRVCQNIPSSDFCRSGPTTYLSIVLGKLWIPAVNDSEGEGFIHIQYFMFSLCLVVLQSSNWCSNGSCLGLLQHDSGVCCCPFGQPDVGYVT